jgi:hypothetical protein
MFPSLHLIGYMEEFYFNSLNNIIIMLKIPSYSFYYIKSRIFYFFTNSMQFIKIIDWLKY